MELNKHPCPPNFGLLLEVGILPSAILVVLLVTGVLLLFPWTPQVGHRLEDAGSRILRVSRVFCEVWPSDTLTLGLQSYFLRS